MFADVSLKPLYRGACREKGLVTTEERECVNVLVGEGLSIVKACLFVDLAARPSAATNETGAEQMLLSFICKHYAREVTVSRLLEMLSPDAF